MAAAHRPLGAAQPVAIALSKTITDHDHPARPQQSLGLGQRLIQRDVLKAFGKQTDVERPLQRRILEHRVMHHSTWRILAAAPRQIGRWHHDLDAVAQRNQMRRRLPRPATDIQNPQSGPLRQQGQQLGRIGILRRAKVGRLRLQPRPQPIMQVFLARQPFCQRAADLKPDGARINTPRTHTSPRLRLGKAAAAQAVSPMGHVTPVPPMPQ